MGAGDRDRGWGRGQGMEDVTEGIRDRAWGGDKWTGEVMGTGLGAQDRAQGVGIQGQGQGERTGQWTGGHSVVECEDRGDRDTGGSVPGPLAGQVADVT